MQGGTLRPVRVASCPSLRPPTQLQQRRRERPARPAMAASNNGNGVSAAAPDAAAPAEQPAQPVAGSAAVGVGAPLAELQQLGRAEAEVELVRSELSELRALLIAQARLVQSQQQHIRQLQAAVGQAVVEHASAAGSAAAAARTAVRSAAAEVASAAAEAADAADSTLAAPEIPAPPAEAAAAAPAHTCADLPTEGTPPGAPPGRSAVLESMRAEEERARRALQSAQLHDRRLTGLFDARYHSTAWGATPQDMRVLPKRIFLVRHAESEGNVDNVAYTYMPDARVPLTARGWQQAICAGDRLRAEMDALEGGRPYKLFFYTSPYLRSRQTYEGLVQAFDAQQVKGVQEEVQLREQDYGNFQDAEGKKREKAERLRFGRFFYRFPNGESGADVYDRMTIFEDHLVRDINAGRFADNTSLVLVTHGLALRIFLMRWFHWTVDQFMCVFNPPNAQPLVLERVPSDTEARQGGPAAWIHTKALYRLSDTSRDVIKGCTEEMCQTSWMPRQISPLDPADSMLLP